MAKKKIENMSKDELIEENHKLMEQRREIKEKQLEIGKLIDKRVAEEKVARMSDAERRNLAQVIEPEGIPSQEAVNEGG